MFVERHSLGDFYLTQSGNGLNITLGGVDLSYVELMDLLAPIVNDVECLEILIIDDFK